VESLEKEHRSTAMRLQFMNRQHSELTLKIESLEARNEVLTKDNARLRGLWGALCVAFALRCACMRACVTAVCAAR
jgi:hypothetical protein